MGVVTLDRPPVNAVDATVVDQIAEVAATIAAAPEIGAVVVRGGERAFSAGADLKAIRALVASEGADAAGDLVTRMQAAFTDVANLSIPTIAAIRGAALGGGLELALACDLRVAANEAKIGFPEVGHGLLPGAGGTQRTTHVAGPAVAAGLMLSGELVDGSTAQRMGVVQWAVPDAEVEERALELGKRLAESPAATAAIKRCIALAPSEAGFEHELVATRELYATSAVQQRLADF